MENNSIFYKMENSGLSNKEIKSIKSIFSNYPQIEEVLIYGSRAKGNHRPASDIDLTLKGKNIDLTLQTKIEFDLDDLLLPYKFDISIYDRITNPEFINHIDKIGKTLYVKKSITIGNKL